MYSPINESLLHSIIPLAHLLMKTEINTINIFVQDQMEAEKKEVERLIIYPLCREAIESIETRLGSVVFKFDFRSKLFGMMD